MTTVNGTMLMVRMLRFLTGTYCRDSQAILIPLTLSPVYNTISRQKKKIMTSGIALRAIRRIKPGTHVDSQRKFAPSKKMPVIPTLFHVFAC